MFGNSNVPHSLVVLFDDASATHTVSAVSSLCWLSCLFLSVLLRMYVLFVIDTVCTYPLCAGWSALAPLVYSL